MFDWLRSLPKSNSAFVAGRGFGPNERVSVFLKGGSNERFIRHLELDK